MFAIGATAVAAGWSCIKYIKFIVRSKQKEISRSSRNSSKFYQLFLQFIHSSSMTFNLHYKPSIEASLSFHFKLLDELIDSIKKVEQEKPIKKREREFLWDQMKLVAPLKFITSVSLCSFVILTLCPSSAEEDSYCVEGIVCKMETEFKSIIYDSMAKYFILTLKVFSKRQAYKDRHEFHIASMFCCSSSLH